MHHAGDYAELGAHARGEIERRTAPHLGKCDLETRRRFCADQGGRGGGKSRIGSARGTLGVERGEDVLDQFSLEQRLDRLASRRHRPVGGRLRARGQRRVERDRTTQCLDQVGKLRRGDPVGGNARGHGVRGIEPLAGERAISTEGCRQARQEEGRPNVGKEADAHLGHGEHELVAGDAMGAVDRDADAPAHDDAVDERHIGLAIAFDAGVERVFLAKIGKRLLVPSGAPQVVECAQIPARREGAGVIRSDDHARDLGITLPVRELSRQRAHHGERHRVERMRPVERDETRCAAPLEQDIARAHALAHR
jgi:hypothetical protein